MLRVGRWSNGTRCPPQLLDTDEFRQQLSVSWCDVIVRRDIVTSWRHVVWTLRCCDVTMTSESFDIRNSIFLYASPGSCILAILVTTATDQIEFNGHLLLRYV